MVKRGKLFVIEGPDGVGKTTINNLLLQQLEEILPFIGWVRMRQPENFRDEIGNTDPTNWLKMLTLFMEDRKVQLPIIQEHLEAGRCVLLDRYYYSSMVYQSIESGVSMEEIYDGHIGINPIIVTPDETFILDASDEIIEKRIAGSAGKDLSNFDNRQSLQRYVRSAYRELPSLPCLKEDTITTILCDREPLDIVSDISKHIETHL